MKKYVILIALGLFMSIADAFAQTADASAQTHEIESNLWLDAGLSSCSDETCGVALSVSYGLDIYLSNRLSLMPFAGIGTISESLSHFGAVGADFVDYAYGDLGIGVRYHFANIPLVIGFAPFGSYMLTDETYYIDWNPSDPRQGLSKMKHLDFGLKPGIYWDVRKKLRLGLEANLGLRNVKIQYPEYDETGSMHVNSINFTVGWHF